MLKTQSELVTARGKNVLFVKNERRKSLDEITAKFNESTPVKLFKVSRRTVQRELHSLGYKRRVVCKKMGIREVNRKKRLQYARGKVHWTVDRT